jgi:hypothetical protein
MKVYMFDGEMKVYMFERFYIVAGLGHLIFLPQNKNIILFHHAEDVFT